MTTGTLATGTTIPQATQLKFELTLPNGTTYPYVIVAGGADADRDGTVEDNGEYGAFTRTGNVWSYTQIVPSPLHGMLFYVQLTVGPSVGYDLTIKDAAGSLLYRNQNVTVDATETIRWELP